MTLRIPYFHPEPADLQPMSASRLSSIFKSWKLFPIYVVNSVNHKFDHKLKNLLGFTLEKNSFSFPSLETESSQRQDILSLKMENWETIRFLVNI